MGANQVTYGNGRWSGSAIQLECGNYEGPFRFHLRLFQARHGDAGERALRDPHPRHDAAPGPVVGARRAVRHGRAAARWHARLARPTSLPGAERRPDLPRDPGADLQRASRALTRPHRRPGRKPATADVGIKNDGHTTVFNIATQVAIVDGPGRTRDLNLSFNQGVPRPFCNEGPTDYVFAQSLPGTQIVFDQNVDVAGRHVRRRVGRRRCPLGHAHQPADGPAVGATQFANVYERHEGEATGSGHSRPRPIASRRPATRPVARWSSRSRSSSRSTTAAPSSSRRPSAASNTPGLKA